MDSKESLCKVCGDKASGKHYGVASCDGCRGFFKRSIRRNLDYVCKERGHCIVDVTRRNQCQACRFRKCLQVNMKKDAVQHERAPRCSGSGANLSATSPPSIAAVPHQYYQQHQPHHQHQQGFLPMPLVYPPPPIPLTIALQRPHFIPPPLPLVGGCGGGSVCYKVQASPEEEEVTSSQEAATNTPTTDQSENTATNAAAVALLMTGAEHHYHHHYGFVAIENNIVETSKNVLALSVRCIRAIPSFQRLCQQDQSSLLQESWKDLFILTLAQWSLPVDHEAVLRGCSRPKKNEADDEEEAMKKELGQVCRLMTRLAQLRIDHTEYACLKALVLFKPETVGTADVEALQEQTQSMLREYCGWARFGRLALALMAVCSSPRRAVLAIFFGGDSALVHGLLNHTETRNSDY